MLNFLFPFSLLSSYGFPAAGSAESLAVVCVGIAFTELMPMIAMGFTFVYGGWRIASKQVFSHRYWFEMFWVDARHIATQMVDSKPFWYWAYSKFVRQTVCIAFNVAVLAYVEMTVTFRNSTANPNPASIFSPGFVHMSPELIRDRHCFSHDAILGSMQEANNAVPG